MSSTTSEAIRDWRFYMESLKEMHEFGTPKSIEALLVKLDLQEECYANLERLAADSETPGYILEALARYRSTDGSAWRIHRQLLDNPALPDAVLEVLARNPSVAIRQALVHRRDCPASVRAQAARSLHIVKR